MFLILRSGLGQISKQDIMESNLRPWILATLEELQSKAEELCEQADSCMHDTVPVCGQMGEVKRTFLDLCDLIEYGCDTNQIFAHVEGTPDCPDPENVRPKPKKKISIKESRRKQHN